MINKNRIVLHKQVYIKIEKFGGEVNTTLCRRQTSRYWNKLDGNNVALKDKDVNCKFCLNIMYHRGLITQKEYIKRKNE